MLGDCRSVPPLITNDRDLSFCHVLKVQIEFQGDISLLKCMGEHPLFFFALQFDGTYPFLECLVVLLFKTSWTWCLFRDVCLYPQFQFSMAIDLLYLFKEFPLGLILTICSFPKRVNFTQVFKFTGIILLLVFSQLELS